MPYICMCFGWYQELLGEVRVDDLRRAEAKLFEMLDKGGMIVHVYRDTDRENPEVVGRHRRFRNFFAPCESSGQPPLTELPHEVERFLLDRASLDTWSRARKIEALLEGRWSIVDLWSSFDLDASPIYGKAVLVASPHHTVQAETDVAAGSAGRQSYQH